MSYLILVGIIILIALGILIVLRVDALLYSLMEYRATVRDMLLPTLGAGECVQLEPLKICVKDEGCYEWTNLACLPKPDFYLRGWTYFVKVTCVKASDSYKWRVRGILQERHNA